MLVGLTIIALAISGLLFSGSRGLLAAHISLAALLLFLTAGWEISNHFTGEGITLATLAHLYHGMRHGELGTTRFPLLVAATSALTFLFVLWAAACIRSNLRQTYYRRYNIPKIYGWIFVLAVTAALPSHPAASDIAALYKSLDSKNEPLANELLWAREPLSQSSQPKSLIYIYLESFERTFLNDDIFPGVAPLLSGIESEGLSIHGVRNAPFTNWTVAGMSASQCGIPLSPLNNSHSKEAHASTPYCIGNLMKNAGYTLSYIGGADISFAGKGRFYRNQQFDQIVGLHEIQRQHPSSPPTSQWGIYDDIVLDVAKEEFQRLKKSGRPFGLFLLTTATHPHSGFPSPSCFEDRSRKFSNPMLNAAHCSDSQAIEFVRWIQSQGDQDLVIVLASDHLQVAGDAADLLNSSPNRDNLFIALGRDIEPRVIDRASTMMDIAPTTAFLIGLGVTKMGLGRSLLHPDPTLSEKYGHDTFASMIPGWRLTSKNSGVQNE